MAEATLTARSAVAAHLKSIGSAPAGVTVSERGLALATVIALGDAAVFADTVRRATGITPIEGPKRVTNGPLAFIGTGPRAWLTASEPDRDLAATLVRDLEGVAAVSDQSDGYVVLRLSGPKVRATLEKGVGVDLHPRAFQPDDTAVTMASHFGIILWQLDHAPTYEVAVFRSLAIDFCHWLTASAAEFGVAVDKGRG